MKGVHELRLGRRDDLAMMKCKHGVLGCRICDLEAELASVHKQLAAARAAHKPLLEVPPGWFVQELGQAMASMLWFCHLVEFRATGAGGRRHRVLASDCETAEAALGKAKRLIEARSFVGEELCEAS